MTLLAGIVAGVLAIVFAWPWLDPYLIRRDVRGRLLDRMAEEWDREDDAAPKDWRW